MLTGTIVQYCAPTLAGLKAGSLFSYHWHVGDQESLVDTINERLADKGVHFVIMKRYRGIILIYAYRTNLLQAIL